MGLGQSGPLEFAQVVQLDAAGKPTSTLFFSLDPDGLHVHVREQNNGVMLDRSSLELPHHLRKETSVLHVKGLNGALPRHPVLQSNTPGAIEYALFRSLDEARRGVAYRSDLLPQEEQHRVKGCVYALLETLERRESSALPK